MIWTASDLFWSETNLRTLLPATFLMAAFALLLRRLIGTRERPLKNLPFQILTVFLIVIEIIKQVREIRGGAYSTWSLPLHFSSIYLYLFPLTHFSKGRFREAMAGATVVAAGMTTIGTLLFPMTVFGNSAESYFLSFDAFHTITFHYVIILYFFLFIALEVNKPDWKRDVRTVFWMVTLFSVVAGTAANLLETNFTSFYTCAFPPVEAMRMSLHSRFGETAGQTIYGLFMYVCILADSTLALLLYRSLDRLIRFFPIGLRETMRTSTQDS